MTQEQLLNFTKRISYDRPNRKLSFEKSNSESVNVKLEFRTADFKTGQEVIITHSHLYFPEHVVYEEHFLYLVRQQIERAEVHEAQEFFKFDGKLVADPHA